MFPEIFPILKNDASVTALLGSSPLRVYPWGRTPQGGEIPYAVYSVYNALPENNLDCPPNIDNLGTQINIYAESPSVLSQCFIAIRDALEPHGHMLNYSTPDREEDTNLYSIRMEFDFWTAR